MGAVTAAARQRRLHLLGLSGRGSVTRIAVPPAGRSAPGRAQVHRAAARVAGAVRIAWPGARGHERCTEVCVTGSTGRPVRHDASKRTAAAERSDAASVRMGRGGASLRSDGGAATLGTLVVDFSRFGQWYEIDSVLEGRFLERVARGSFAATIASGNAVRVLFGHGRDAFGSLVLGVPSVLEERAQTAHLEAPLLDTGYNRDLLPGLKAGAYGSSFMFSTLAEEWVQRPGRSAHNPAGWPERTLTEVELYEAGPVTWPANPGATAGVRSGTDWFASRCDERAGQRLARAHRAVRSVRGL